MFLFAAYIHSPTKFTIWSKKWWNNRDDQRNSPKLWITAQRKDSNPIKWTNVSMTANSWTFDTERWRKVGGSAIFRKMIQYRRYYGVWFYWFRNITAYFQSINVEYLILTINREMPKVIQFVFGNIFKLRTTFDISHREMCKFVLFCLVSLFYPYFFLIRLGKSLVFHLKCNFKSFFLMKMSINHLPFIAASLFTNKIISKFCITLFH